MNVVLKMAVGQLDEVIVSTGYTQTTQKRTTGSVAVVGREVFENKVPTSIDQLLQGQVAGVSIVAKSGRPGESAKIRIRGRIRLPGMQNLCGLLMGYLCNVIYRVLKKDELKRVILMIFLLTVSPG